MSFAPLFSFDMIKTIYLATTDSTNRDAVELARDGAENGTAVLAERQTNGRGRLDRSWYSPSGKGLYCSIIVRPEIALEDYPKITFTAGLSVITAIEKVCGCCASVKWPNDIYMRGKKLGGILTEAAYSSDKPATFFAVVGIGLNINCKEEDFPPQIQNIATSVLLETGKMNSINDLFEQIRHELLKDLESFQKNGFVNVISRWKEKDMLQGKSVSWIQQKGPIIRGVAQGPDLEGKLIIKDNMGNIHNVIAGDVIIRN